MTHLVMANAALSGVRMLLFATYVKYIVPCGFKNANTDDFEVLRNDSDKHEVFLSSKKRPEFCDLAQYSGIPLKSELQVRTLDYNYLVTELSKAFP